VTAAPADEVTAPGAIGAPSAPVRVDAGSLGWRLAWRVLYAIVRHVGPLVRLVVAAEVPTFPNRILELRLVGRRTGRPRTVLVTLITIRGRWYVGHPNGRAGWLANLAAVDATSARVLGQAPVRVRSMPLALGAERTAVIHETARQQPFLARQLYRAAQRHILRAGVYCRLEPV
jgi:hypothetical protein